MQQENLSRDVEQEVEMLVDIQLGGARDGKGGKTQSGGIGESKSDETLKFTVPSPLAFADIKLSSTVAYTIEQRGPPTKTYTHRAEQFNHKSSVIRDSTPLLPPSSGHKSPRH